MQATQVAILVANVHFTADVLGRGTFPFVHGMRARRLSGQSAALYVSEQQRCARRSWATVCG